MTLVLILLGPILVAALGVAFGALDGRERVHRRVPGGQLPDARSGQPAETKLTLASSGAKLFPQTPLEPRRSLANSADPIAKPAEALASTGTNNRFSS